MSNSPLQVYLATIKALPLETYNGLQFIYVLKGQLTLYVNKTPLNIRPNELMLINPNDLYSMQGDDLNIVFILKIPIHYLKQQCSDILQYRYHCQLTENTTDLLDPYQKIKQHLISILLAHCTKQEGYPLDIKTHLFQLLHLLFIHFKITQHHPLVETHILDARIASTVNYINNNFQQELSLETLAKRAHISIHYLSRLFKKELGIGFLHYINDKRLEAALNDLMYTNDTVLKIALQNGFANANAFTHAFKNKYGEAPSQFKQHLHQKTKLTPAKAHYQLLDLEDIEDLTELTNYLKTTQYSHSQLDTEAPASPQINSQVSHPHKIHTPYMLRIGKLAEALSLEVQQQLQLAQKTLTPELIHCEGIFNDGICQRDSQSIYHFYEYNQLFLFFQKVNLIPFIQINISLLIEQNYSIIEVTSILKNFLQFIVRNFSSNYLALWKFELNYTSAIENETFLSYYLALFDTIKSFAPTTEIGLYYVNALTIHQVPDHSLNLLKLLVTQARAPQFLTLMIDPNASIEETTESYTHLKYYQLDVIKTLQQRINETFKLKIPLYITYWNTLTGQNFIEAGSFYRAALVVEALSSLAPLVAGLSFWLSEQLQEKHTQKATNNTLSLFHCLTAKKSTFFILQAYNKLGSNLLFKNEQIIATQNAQNDLIVLISNPCYFKPKLAMDFNFTHLQHNKILVHLTQLEPANYRIKSFLFSMNFTFAVNDQQLSHKIDTYKYNDEDVLAYVENIAAPSFALYEKYLNNYHTINVDLALNGAILYIFQRI